MYHNSSERIFAEALKARMTYLTLLTSWVLLFSVHLQPAFSDHPFDLDEERKVVEENWMEPTDALREAYDRSQVLVLGLSNHRHSTPFHYLEELLKDVGQDPALKIIAVEWMRDHSEVFERMSVESIEYVLDDYQFPSEHEKQLYLCTSHEKAYSFGSFMPFLRELNRTRTGNEVIVHAVDGFRSDKKFSWPYRPFEETDVQHTDCSLRNRFYFLKFTSTESRERQTAVNFFEQVWSNVGPNDKVIVLYHFVHLLPGVQSCNSRMEADLSFSTGIGPASWLEFFFESHPEARAAFTLVYLDEVDPNHHPYGVFQTVHRNRQVANGESWAMDLDHLQGLDLERGSSVFMPNAIMLWQKEGMIYSTKRIYDLTDYIIFTPEAEAKFRYRADAQEFYLGGACPDGRYDGRSLFEE